MREHPGALAELLARVGGGTGWSLAPLGASGFCTTWRARRGTHSLFLKTLPAAQADTLQAEADGLQALADTHTLRVPAVAVCVADDPQHALLALQWLDFAPADASFGVRFGRALADLHRAPVIAEAQGRYGWRRDNRLGASLQRNGWSTTGGVRGWIDFFGSMRLGALRDALRARDGAAQGALCDAVDAVIARLPRCFDDGHVPRPSLIHGDLWSGNWAMLADGAPVVYDPAVSCSDAEAELAMLELFGAPPAGFRAAYREAGAGPAPGYARRRPIYQLHHLLNHALLFGAASGYAGRSLALARRILAQ